MRSGPAGPAAIPRYEMGYDYLLKALAARGYAVVAPNLVGAFTEAPSWAPPDDSTAAASMDYYRVEPLVDRLLAELAAANQGQSLAFGQDLTGKLDLSHMAIIGHSRGGEWANMLALRRAGSATPEEIAAGRGPVSGLFLLTPAHGDFVDPRPGRPPHSRPAHRRRARLLRRRPEGVSVAGPSLPGASSAGLRASARRLG